MAYKVYSLLCRNHDHGEMEYKGEGDFECPVCGFTYHDDDYDDVDYDSEESSDEADDGDDEYYDPDLDDLPF